MKRLIPIVLALLCLASSSPAGPGGCTNSPSLTPYASEAITVSSTALGFTAATFGIGGTTPAMAVVSVESFGIRTRVDGLNPTAAVGMPFAATSTFTVCGQQSIRNIRFIRQTSDAALWVDYYKEGN